MGCSKEFINLINNLQNTCLKVSNHFFNGEGISFINKIFYPNPIYLSAKLSLRLNELFYFLTKLGAYRCADYKTFRELETYIQKIRHRHNFSYRDIAKLLSLYYAYFEDISSLLKSETKLRKTKVSKVLSYENYPKEDLIYLNPIFSLKNFIQNKLSAHLVEYIIHGSLSTRDYIKGHSDVDTFVVLKKEVMKDPKKLLYTRKMLCLATRYFYFIDPLQHHGHYVFAEQDLDYYPQHIFPLTLFNFSTSLFKMNRFEFHERDSKLEMKRMFIEYITTFRKYSNLTNYPKSRYALKFLLQTILLFPAVYLQYKGSRVYKKEAIEKIKKVIPQEYSQLIQNIEKIRKENLFNVPQKMPLFWQNIFEMVPNPLVYPALYRFFHKKIPKKIDGLIKKSLPNQLSGLAAFLEKQLNEK